MPKTIIIKAGSIQLEATLNDTKTALAIWEALPVKASASTWGDEIYFPIPVKLGLEQGQELVDIGDLGYWPSGNAFCIFFGPTPVSEGNEIRPASAVNVFGRITGNTTILKKVPSGSNILIEQKK
jgi:hypothetical protein